MKNWIIRRHKDGRHWSIYKPNGELLCSTLYKKGAVAVVTEMIMINTRSSFEKARAHTKKYVDLAAKKGREKRKAEQSKEGAIKIP